MSFGLALLLTVLAGLSTGIGSLIAFLVKGRNVNFLSFSMGFAAGAMIYVSFTEILGHASHNLSHFYNDEHKAGWVSAIAFFGGMLLIALIDKLTPSHENPHEIMHEQLDKDGNVIDAPPLPKTDKKLMRVGVMTAVALALHNFPEGFATFVSALSDPALGITIAVAIALHNIPEGIAVSIPIYYATGSRKQAFWYSFLSGIVEPIGAVVGYFLLHSFLTDEVVSILLASVAGIMVFISLDQLLPSAEEYGKHHLTIYGVVLGMAVMAVSLLLLMGGHQH